MHSQLNESQTRYTLIGPAIEKARWNLSNRSQIWFEVPVQGYVKTALAPLMKYKSDRPSIELTKRLAA